MGSLVRFPYPWNVCRFLPINPCSAIWYADHWGGGVGLGGATLVYVSNLVHPSLPTTLGMHLEKLTEPRAPRAPREPC